MSRKGSGVSVSEWGGRRRTLFSTGSRFLLGALSLSLSLSDPRSSTARNAVLGTTGSTGARTKKVVVPAYEPPPARARALMWVRERERRKTVCVCVCGKRREVGRLAGKGGGAVLTLPSAVKNNSRAIAVCVCVRARFPKRTNVRHFAHPPTRGVNTHVRARVPVCIRLGLTLRRPVRLSMYMWSGRISFVSPEGNKGRRNCLAAPPRPRPPPPQANGTRTQTSFFWHTRPYVPKSYLCIFFARSARKLMCKG